MRMSSLGFLVRLLVTKMRSLNVRMIGGVIGLGATIALGAFVGYKMATNPELRSRLSRSAVDAYQTSKKKIVDMSEDVAVRTAQMTKNPKINQDWVAHQWESVGY